MTAGGNPLDNLPELPLEKFEAIGPLERSEHGPFLTIKPPRVEAPPPSAPLPQEKIKVSARKQCHFAWATYPVVVCHDPGPFVDGLQIAGPPSPSDPDRPDPNLREVAGRVEHYRLSALAGRTFPRPLWCTVRYGPWYGKFVEQESCTQDDNVPMWYFWLEGVQAPDLGVVSWLGSITDMPTVPSLSIIWGTLQSKAPRYAACGAAGFPKPPERPA